MNDGGPAFPQNFREGLDGFCGAWDRGMGGMSLRDWFAGMALQFLLNENPHIEDTGNPYESIAKASYKAADAMIEEREK